MPKLNTISIHGFKSIRALDNFELRPINILIGGNGAGKSNFIEFFRMLRAMAGFSLPGLPVSGLKKYIAIKGGSEVFLWNGSQYTQSIHFEIPLADALYEIELSPTLDENFFIQFKRYDINKNYQLIDDDISHVVDNHINMKNSCMPFEKLYEAIRSWHIYSFHDVNMIATKTVDIMDFAYIRPDGWNLASVLHNIKEKFPRSYNRILRSIQLVAPFFEDFVFTPLFEEKIRLDWKQKNSDYIMKSYQFSDGTLRYIALATALLQPEPPALMLIDEPELGLHPQALPLLAEMIKSASTTSQVVVATQSAALLDYFQPEDVVVVNRQDGASVFQRLNPEDYTHWLEEYSLGTLWDKNVIDGGPHYE